MDDCRVFFYGGNVYNTFTNIQLEEGTEATAYEPYKENIDERLIQNKSAIAINKSALGYQRKNLLPYPQYLLSVVN